MITDCSYGGTNRAARVMFSDLGIAFTFTDFRDPEKVKAAIRPNTKLIFSETPANPTLTLTDLRVRNGRLPRPLELLGVGVKRSSRSPVQRETLLGVCLALGVPWRVGAVCALAGITMTLSGGGDEDQDAWIVTVYRYGSPTLLLSSGRELSGVFPGGFP